MENKNNKTNEKKQNLKQKVDLKKEANVYNRQVIKKEVLKKTKVNYKSKAKKLEEEIKLLKIQNISLEIENQKNINEFQKLAKTFQTKAQIQINKKKKELATKLDKDKDSIKKYGSQKLLEAIIEPILNIEAAINAGKNNEAVSAYVMGFEMLLNQIYQELEAFGVSTIKPKVDSNFISEEHQVLNVIEGGETNKINKLIKKGFKLHDRVFKPALVDIND